MYDEVTIKASSAKPKREKTMQWGTEIKKKYYFKTRKEKGLSGFSVPFWKTFDTASLMERKILPQIDFVATPPSAPPLWKMMFLGFLNSIQLYFWVNALFTLCESYLHSFNYAFFWTKSIFDASQETIKKIRLL